MLGVHVEAGPSTQEIIAALERCEGWSRDDRKRLAYLAIFTGYIEGRKYSTPTRVSLARLVMELERFENYPWGRVAFKVWVYTALPELGATFGNPLPNNPSPPILAYKGHKGRRQFKEAILSTIPSFCKSNKVWGTNIDDIYAPVNFADSHWIAIWISIPKRHIVVFDSICSSISPEDLDVVMEPFLYMIPYLLVECAS
ncbi:unnamed protein product [Brassica oleracea]